jgi:hypothetical protein
MKRFIAVLSLAVSMSSIASTDSVLNLRDLVNHTKGYNDQKMELMDARVDACKTITECKSDFKGNTTCSAKLVCDWKK